MALSAIPGIKAVKVLKDGIQYLKITPESGEAGKALKELYDVEKTAGMSGDIPSYIKNSCVPLDRETVLGSKEYKKTNIKVKGAQVYKKGDYYYYRDTFHTGEAAHLEVFDKRGNHIGEANPQTGELIPGTVDSTKKLI
ncbi:hypothetical protein [Pectinatus frisingensis]|jgi:hypothetical protein|uniref:hypothetical protein n=2 Tax=Pectinatus frisingensis TaxID=865 RepID=UPI0018C4B952|nr:hypothetical protein [Pectinatus frisingensis]